MQEHLKELESLLKDFYTLTGIKICVYDKSGNELCYYPEKFSDFCRCIRKNKHDDTLCVQCDKNAIEVCKRTKKQFTYTCHAGLTECISPIILDGTILGYFVIGQIRQANGKNLKNVFWDEYDRLPEIPPQKLSASMRILDACAGYEYLKKLASGLNTIDARITDYIDSNIERSITAKELYNELRISRNELYAIFKEYFNTTPADYIKKRRIEKACDLLRTTRKPINEIAVLCGIPDYNYFPKVFKRIMGISPRQYRNSK